MISRRGLFTGAAALTGVVCVTSRGEALPFLNVKRSVLTNGLTILLLEDHNSPTVSLVTRYKVGSRNEVPGITGLSHLFEHMMFNGSAKYPPGELDQVIESGGGYANASTTADVTEYVDEFSPSALLRVLDIEADRLRSLKLDRVNLEQERAIVMEERRQSVDDSIEGAMEEALYNLAFASHPYRWSTFGFMKDLAAISLSDAKAYFNSFYSPNNLILSVVGDFDSRTLLPVLAQTLGSIQKRNPPRPVVNAEPTQNGERRAVLRKRSELAYALIGYKSVSLTDPRTPALEIAASILGSGKSSRLYQRLVYDLEVATSVSASHGAQLHPGLFTLQAQGQAGHSSLELESAIHKVTDELIFQEPSTREIAKAVANLEYAYVRRFETNTGRASLIAENEHVWGDWRALNQYLLRLQAVTPSEVRRSANNTFRPTLRTVVSVDPSMK